MALGFYLTENVVNSATDGSQLNLGTWDIKVPAAHDIPLSLNVSFSTPATPNHAPIAVLGSKASGEPPMCLGAAIVLATRDAIRASHSDRDAAATPQARAASMAANGALELRTPLTVERVQRSCGVTIDEFIL